MPNPAMLSVRLARRLRLGHEHRAPFADRHAVAAAVERPHRFRQLPSACASAPTRSRTQKTISLTSSTPPMIADGTVPFTICAAAIHRRGQQRRLALRDGDVEAAQTRARSRCACPARSQPTPRRAAAARARPLSRRTPACSRPTSAPARTPCRWRRRRRPERLRRHRRWPACAAATA